MASSSSNEPVFTAEAVSDLKDYLVALTRISFRNEPPVDDETVLFKRLLQKMVADMLNNNSFRSEDAPFGVINDNMKRLGTVLKGQKEANCTLRNLITAVGFEAIQEVKNTPSLEEQSPGVELETERLETMLRECFGTRGFVFPIPSLANVLQNAPLDASPHPPQHDNSKVSKPDEMEAQARDADTTSHSTDEGASELHCQLLNMSMDADAANE